MSKVLRTVGTIAAGAALIATGVGAVGGLGIVAGATATKVGAIAGLAAGVANIGAQITAPKPIARGSIIDVIIEAEPPRPKMLGETFFAGVMVHRAGYGAPLKGVDNPYWVDVRVISGTGRINGILSENFNFIPIDMGYYANFYTSDQRLGLPGQTAMVPPFGAAPGWDSNSRLEGCAAQLSNYKFDRDGERFSSGFPPYGVVGQGVYCYDPRKDSTRPGGSGSHRVDDPTTYEYTENVALHAGQYLYGDYLNGVHVFGWGLDDDGIDWDAIALWANDCQANNWRISGIIFEGGPRFSGPEIKTRNLDDICAAGGARWFEYGGKISFDLQRPRVPLATIRDADRQEEGGDIVTTQSLRDRFSAVLPKWTSPDHQWNQITGEKIVGSTYVAEDGREIIKDWALNLVRDEQQAGELASYAMADSREVGPITLTLGAEWRFGKPGDCFRIESEEENFASDVVVMNASYDPTTLKTTFTLKGETPGKHDFALGKTAVPPPTPIVGQTPQQRDKIAAGNINPRGSITVRSRVPQFPYTPEQTEIVIIEHDVNLSDGRTITLPAATLNSLDEDTAYRLFWNLVTEEYVIAVSPASAEIENRQLIALTPFRTADSAGDFTDPTPPPPGIPPPTDGDFQ
jgi:hypothetical protein